jgi:hypothetical protein
MQQQYQCLDCNHIYTHSELRATRRFTSYAPCGHAYTSLEPFKEPAAHMTRHNSVGVIFKRENGLIEVCVIPDNEPVYYLSFTTDADLVQWFKTTINRRAA